MQTLDEGENGIHCLAVYLPVGDPINNCQSKWGNLPFGVEFASLEVN